jgi:ribosomal protein S18 acetylase RimI-like enzyme
MEHVLDNPVWNALISGNAPLANGTEGVKFFDEDVSPFVALKENTAANFGELHQLTHSNKPAIFVALSPIQIPAGWTLLHHIPGLQMVHETGLQPLPSTPILDLTSEHVPQMVALTQLTNPGPFASRTIAFGHYKGVFKGDELVAMAGQRFNPFNFTEISAVCTHPSHLGKGYARQLLIYHINKILADSCTPFLHVRGDNERAIKVYESLGFKTRTNIHFFVMKRKIDNAVKV